ncbi:MAG TPA: hypothetical protein VGR28_00660 [Candidatus Thermoplasmatota archaeon]|jgi:hypothetical protein|nr:hypothetical protein [Candidatus Thermoplasmatota archaeon]
MKTRLASLLALGALAMTPFPMAAAVETCITAQPFNIDLGDLGGIGRGVLQPNEDQWWISHAQRMQVVVVADLPITVDVFVSCSSTIPVCGLNVQFVWICTLDAPGLFTHFIQIRDAGTGLPVDYLVLERPLITI